MDITKDNLALRLKVISRQVKEHSRELMMLSYKIDMLEENERQPLELFELGRMYEQVNKDYESDIKEQSMIIKELLK